MTSAQINDLKNLDEELAKDNLRGLWAREESVRREPAPFGKPILWKWAAIRAGLDAAGRLIATNYKGARRAISLIHPNMNESTSHTLNLAAHRCIERGTGKNHVLNVARDQCRNRDGRRNIDHLDVEAGLLEKAVFLGDDQREGNQPADRVADPDFLQIASGRVGD